MSKTMCLNCGTSTKNPKFCSKSCAAKVNNSACPKRKVESQNLCTRCGCRLSRRKGGRKTQLCLKCFAYEEVEMFGSKTKGEVIEDSLNYASKHKYEKIRQHAKRCAKRFGWQSNACERCGYSIHVELCHKKPIHAFPDDAHLHTINSKANIAFLCPNCHWELDNS